MDSSKLKQEQATMASESKQKHPVREIRQTCESKLKRVKRITIDCNKREAFVKVKPEGGGEGRMDVCRVVMG